MKISDRTLDVLRYCAKINEHIVIEKGNVIRSVNKFGTLMLRAKVPEEFPCEVRLAKLDEFFKILTIFDEPEFDIYEDKIEIFDKYGSRQEYPYPDKGDLLHEQRNPPEMESVASFPMSVAQYKNIKKALSVNRVEDIEFSCGMFEGEHSDKDGKVFARVHNKKRKSEEFSIDFSANSDQRSDVPFSVYLRHARQAKKGAQFNIMEVDYVVHVGKLNRNPAMKFIHINDSHAIEYLIAGEYGSTIMDRDDVPF